MIYLLQKINYLKLFWNVILVIQTEKKSFSSLGHRYGQCYQLGSCYNKNGHFQYYLSCYLSSGELEDS